LGLKGFVDVDLSSSLKALYSVQLFLEVHSFMRCLFPMKVLPYSCAQTKPKSELQF